MKYYNWAIFLLVKLNKTYESSNFYYIYKSNLPGKAIFNSLNEKLNEIFEISISERGVVRDPQTHWMDSFTTIVNGYELLTIVTKGSILHVSRGSWLRLCTPFLYPFSTITKPYQVYEYYTNRSSPYFASNIKRIPVN